MKGEQGGEKGMKGMQGPTGTYVGDPMAGLHNIALGMLSVYLLV